MDFWPDTSGLDFGWNLEGEMMGGNRRLGFSLEAEGWDFEWHPAGTMLVGIRRLD